MGIPKKPMSSPFVRLGFSALLSLTGLGWAVLPSAEPTATQDSALLNAEESHDLGDQGSTADLTAPAVSTPNVGESVASEGLGDGPILSVPGSAYGQYRLGRMPLVTDEEFPADSVVAERARFWFHIYTQIGEGEGLIHDVDHPGIVYHRLEAPGAYSRAGRQRIEGALRSVQVDLKLLAASGNGALDARLQALKSILPLHWDSATVADASERIRFQRGLRERFVAGLGRSYRWLGDIESTFVTRGLPSRLKYLPHVESSFQPFAYSKVGAAGMWQFMKGTARQYGLKASYLVDERRDPARSTEAATKLLRDSYARLGSWPLALTGYNHGPAGVARAVAAMGSRDLGVIIRGYGGKSFGFASGNFYAEFMAASSIALKADSLFPKLAKEKPQPMVGLTLGQSTGIRRILQVTGLSPAELEACNLALRPAVFKGGGSLPKGLKLKLPWPADTVAVLAALHPGARDKKSDLVLAMASPPADKAQALPTPPSVKESQTMQAQSTAKSAIAKPIASTSRPSKETPVLAAKETKSITRQSSAKIAASPEPGLSAALDAPVSPSPVAAEMQKGLTEDFALLTADAGDWGHPYDRFDSSVYNLDYIYENGELRFRSGPQETLSHYAEWSGQPMAVIRKATRLRGRRELGLGREIRLRLSREQADAFQRQREENYRGVEEDFYGSYHVSSLEPLKVEKGMSVWSLAMDRELPYWLLQKHNQARDLAALHPGDTLQIPVVEAGLRRWGFTRYAGPQDQLRAMAQRLRLNLTP